MAAIVLSFEAVVLALVTPVMITVADVRPSTALPVCLGLAGLAVVAAALLRYRAGYILGYLIQVAAVGLGFIVPVMFVLGLVFAGLWIMAMVLGRRIESFKAQTHPTNGQTGPTPTR